MTLQPVTSLLSHSLSWGSAFSSTSSGVLDHAGIYDNARKLAQNNSVEASQHATELYQSVSRLNQFKLQAASPIDKEGLYLNLRKAAGSYWCKLSSAVALAIDGISDSHKGEQILRQDPDLVFKIKCTGEAFNLLDKLLNFQQEQYKQQRTIAQLHEISMHLNNYQRFKELANSLVQSGELERLRFLQYKVNASKALTLALRAFDQLPDSVSTALSAMVSLDGGSSGGALAIKTDPTILLWHNNKNLIDFRVKSYLPVPILMFVRPVLPIQSFQNADSPLIIHDRKILETLEKFLDHLNNPSKNNDFLKSQFLALPKEISSYLGYMLWVLHGKPEIHQFGDQEILRDVRALVNVKTREGVNIISQLIQHFKARIKLERQELALKNFKLVISRLPISHQRAWFEAIEPELQTKLAYRVWLNDGGKINPTFTSNPIYGHDQIRTNPKAKLLIGASSAIEEHLKEIQNQLAITLKGAASDAARLLIAPDKPVDISFDRLAAQPGLIEELPAENLQVAMISAEFINVIAQGGLASAVEGMARGIGADHVRVIMPKYDVLPPHIKLKLKPDYQVEHGGKVSRVFKAKVDGVRCYFIENDDLFSVGTDEGGMPRSIYAAKDDWTEKARWVHFSSAAAELTYKLSKKKKKPVQIVHSHDAQTALVPGIIKSTHPEEWRRGETPTSVLTFHNHLCPLWFDKSRDLLSSYQLPPKHTALTDGFEHVEMCTTVSETFAKEAQTEKLGFGLQDRVRKLAAQDRLVGIVNGPGNGWDPRTTGALKNWDSYVENGKKIDLTFGPDDAPAKLAATKKRCREELCAALKENFPDTDFDPKKPIALFTARFDSSQKGIDKLPLIMEEIVKQGGQFIVAGIDPDPEASKILDAMKRTIREKNYKGCFVLVDERDPKTKKLKWQFGTKNLAAVMRAGASFVVAPSRYEPCGLIHLEMRRFGVPTLASDTGGHHDTITTSGPHKNGYLFTSVDNWWSKEQNAEVVKSIGPAMKDAQEVLDGLYGSDAAALEAYVKATQTMIRDGLASSWEHSDDDSLSPIQRLEYVYAQAMLNRREKRGKMLLNVTLLS